MLMMERKYRWMVDYEVAVMETGSWTSAYSMDSPLCRHIARDTYTPVEMSKLNSNKVGAEH